MSWRSISPPIATAADGISGATSSTFYCCGSPSSPIVARDNLYEVALWEDLVTVQGDDAFYAYMVDNQAIIIPETIDAIRALAGRERDANVSIATTNTALGMGTLLT